jgi:hypothetical protein
VALISDFVPKGHLTGYQYFDTDLRKPVWFNGDVFGSAGWVDATGSDPYASNEPNT